MKLTKKVLSVLLALIMLMSVVAVSVSASTDFPSYDPAAPALKIGTVNYTGSGNVVVPVSLERNPGVWAVNLQIKFDSNLKLVETEGSLNENCDITTSTCLYSVSDDNVLTMYIESTAGTNGLDNITANGSLIKLTFAPKAYVVGTTYPIEFTYVDRKSIINSDTEDLTNFTFANGGVKCVSNSTNPPVIKPSTPVMASATVTAAKTVTVKWNKANNTKTYDVQRKIGSKAWTTVKSGLTTTSYVDKAASVGGTYYYRVVAKNGSYTATSASKTVKVMAYTTKPVVKTAKAGTKKKTLDVTLKSKITNATGYEIKVGTNSKITKGTKTVKATNTKATMSGLKSKKLYYVKVRPYQKVGSKVYYGAWSAVKKASNKVK